MKCAGRFWLSLVSGQGNFAVAAGGHELLLAVTVQTSPHRAARAA